MQSVAFGGEKYERLEISVKDYERPPTGDLYDDNWLIAEVFVNSGCFEGSFSASFLAADFESFLVEIKNLMVSLRGTAQFDTLEDQLSLKLSGDGIGHICLIGEAYDKPGSSNRLSFEINLDQTQLKNSVQSLQALVNAYPTRRT